VRRDHHLKQMFRGMCQEAFDRRGGQRGPDQGFSNVLIGRVKGMQIGVGFPLFKQ
jgi:hypothetical protein